MINDALYILLFIGAFLGIIITFFIVTMLRYHRRYVKLQKERVMNEIAMLENERKRMAYDLHDSLGPILSSVKLNINSIEASQPEDQAVISKASAHIDEVIRNMRAISYNLLPITLERKGFFEALRAEMKSAGVGVTTAYPGVVATHIRHRGFNAAGVAAGSSGLKEDDAMSVEECARLILQGMARRDREVVMTAKGKLGRWLKLIAPGKVESMALAALKDEVKPL